MSYVPSATNQLHSFSSLSSVLISKHTGLRILLSRQLSTHLCSRDLAIRDKEHISRNCVMGPESSQLMAVALCPWLQQSVCWVSIDTSGVLQQPQAWKDGRCFYSQPVFADLIRPSAIFCRQRDAWCSFHCRVVPRLERTPGWRGQCKGGDLW